MALDLKAGRVKLRIYFSNMKRSKKDSDIGGLKAISLLMNKKTEKMGPEMMSDLTNYSILKPQKNLCPRRDPSADVKEI